MKIYGKLIMTIFRQLAALILVTPIAIMAAPILSAVAAQNPAPQAATQQAAQPAAPPAAPWSASCTGSSRAKPLDCQVEQKVVVSTTGQLLVDMTMRLPTGATAPVMFIHTPFGLFLPAGLQLMVDGAQFATLPLQTCDGAGCYAGSTVTPQLLNAMQHGKTLTVTFQNLQKNNIDVPVSLLGFGTAYNQIQ